MSKDPTTANVLPPNTNTVMEACYKLKLTPPTLYELINSKKLRSYKIGRHRYITDQAIRDFHALVEAEEDGREANPAEEEVT